MTFNNTFISDFRYTDPAYIEPSAPAAEEHSTLHQIASAPCMDNALNAAMQRFSIPSADQTLFIENILLHHESFGIENKKISLERPLQKQVDSLIKELKHIKYSLNLRGDLTAKNNINKILIQIMQQVFSETTSSYLNPLTPWAYSSESINNILDYIAQCKLKEETKVMLDITLRNIFAKMAIEKFNQIGTSKDCFDGARVAHPSSIIFIQFLHKLITKEGKYAPVIDIKYEVLKHIILPYALQLNEMLEEKTVAVDESFPMLKQQFLCHLDGYLYQLSPLDQGAAKTYLIDSFDDTIIEELKNMTCQMAAQTNDPELLARRIKQITLLPTGSTETVAEEMLLKYLSLLSHDTHSSLHSALAVSSSIFNQTTHAGLQALFADQLLAATLQREYTRYELAAKNTLLPTSWLEDIDATYKCFKNEITTEASCLNGKISLPEPIALSSTLFEPLVKKLCQQLKSPSTEVPLKEKCVLAKKLIEDCVQSCTIHIPKEQQPRAKELLTHYLAVKVALHLYLSRGSLHKHLANEEIDITGYLPQSIYQDCTSLQSLLTLCQAELGDFTFIKEDLSYILSIEKINKRILLIEEGLKKEKNHLLQAQKKTLRWALKTLTSPSASITEPPSAADPLFRSKEIELVHSQIDSALEELKRLRGSKSNGLIHEAWVTYIKALAVKILSYDEIAPPSDKEKITNNEIELIKQAQYNEQLLSKAQSRIMDIEHTKDFFTITVGALSMHEYFQEYDLTNFINATEKATKAKEEFDRLKLREKMLVGEGIIPTPIRNEEEDIIGFNAEPHSILGELSKELKGLLTCE